MQPTISVIIIEDEPIWLTQLQLSLERLGFSVVAAYTAIDDALINLPKTEFDIALLDININGKNAGIEFGKIIRSVYSKPIIFITGSLDKHTAAEALVAQPSAYLTKPVNDTSLFVAIQQALQNFSVNKIALSNEPYEPDYFFIKAGNHYKKILWKDVLHLFVEDKYVAVALHNETVIYYLRSSLQKVLQSVIPSSIQNKFIQINRSEILNINYAEELFGTTIKACHKVFEVTDNFMPEVKKALHIIT
ncbi:MAG: response regulator [Bacteroidetes bacterium]|nr:response regulator [Bacteroidota bacterium]